MVKAFGILLLVAGGILVWFCSSVHLTRHKLYVGSLLWGLRDFDSTEWKLHDNDDSHKNRRGDMLFKLLWTHDLIGMTREEVTDLLGRPDEFRGGYLIGHRTGLGIDPDALVIEYDRSGRVSDFYTYQL